MFSTSIMKIHLSVAFIAICLISKATTGSVSDCEAACPVDDATIAVCASNANVYTSFCKVLCSNPDLEQVKTCKSDDIDSCKRSCRVLTIAKCASACPTKTYDQYICATDGNLYNDICRAQCAYSENAIEFNCNGITENCKGYCHSTVHQKRKDCQRNCPTSASDVRVCGSDGIVYNNTCEVDCLKLGIQVLSSYPASLLQEKAEIDCANLSVIAVTE